LKSTYLTVPIRSDKLSLSIQVKTHLSHRQTDFQTIDVYDTEAFGRVLTLDGHIQLAEIDESVYHEFLVHVPLLSIASPVSALVVGGGDGGVLREICKHPSIEHIDIAEIDQGVIDESRKYLPHISDGAFEDPRVKVHITDAFAFVKNTNRQYDLIVVDSTDVYEDEEGGISEQLFTREFYTDCLHALSAEGFVVTQADNPVFCPYSLEHILGLFQSCFKKAGTYNAVIPSFGGYSAFCWGSKGASVLSDFPESRAQSINLSSLNQASYCFAIENAIKPKTTNSADSAVQSNLGDSLC